MRPDVERAVLIQLQAVGLKKLPPAVIDKLVDSVAADVSAALAKSVCRRTAPRNVAKAFAECVMGGRAGDSKGAASPFGKLPVANPDRDETDRLICQHSEPQNATSTKEDGQ